jgi:propanediol utilization protein
MEGKNMEALVTAVLGRIFVELQASGRHVHITKEQAMTLFGHPLTAQRPLSQPGQFLARERVTVVGPKGSFAQVAVLGPERSKAQVEVSLTDARYLGVEAPVRQSGDTRGTPGIRLEGPMGTVTLGEGVLAAQRHIHLTPEAAKGFGVKDQQVVRLQTYTQRPLVFEDVVVRISKDFAPAAHLDFDEANACGFQKGDLGRILP